MSEIFQTRITRISIFNLLRVRIDVGSAVVVAGADGYLPLPLTVVSRQPVGHMVGRDGFTHDNRKRMPFSTQSLSLFFIKSHDKLI